VSDKSSLDEEDAEAAQASQRAEPAADLEFKVFEGVRAQAADPVQPVKLAPGDSFAFRCHRGVSCWNACCHGADVTLTPYDILRLCRHLGLRPAEFLLRHTVPALHAGTDMPVAKLKMGGEDGKGPCAFVAAEGCTVYADRPATCRYYPLGLISVKLKDAERKDDFHFLVREPHCKGHDETKAQSVEEFRHEQGVEANERIDRGWIDILMKLASWRVLGGPMGRSPTDQTKQMFFMVSTDVDRFRRFVLESRFLSVYAVDPDAVERLKTDDEALLALGFAWLKNVLFNEPTVALKEDVLKQAIAKARAGAEGN